MARTDMGRLVVYGSRKPGILYHTGNLRGKNRRPGVAGFESLQRPHKVGQQTRLVDLKVPEYLMQVNVRHIQEFYKEMLHVYFIMGMGQTKPGG